MRVYINGESTQLTDNSSLAEVIIKLGLPATRIAVEINRVVVRRTDWDSTILHDGDRVEVVHFVGGG